MQSMGDKCMVMVVLPRGITCDDTGVVLVAGVAGVADGGGGRGEGPLEAAGGVGGRAPQQRVQLGGDARGGGQARAVAGRPPAAPRRRPPPGVVPRGAAERH